jgi:(S)-ureidoglycine aminohydrolase
MAQQGLVGSRVVVERNFAILPPEGIPESVLPEWTGTAARILAAPPLGARFVQYLLDLSPGGGATQELDSSLQAFFYVLAGRVRLDLNGQGHSLEPGGFAYLSPGSRFGIAASGGPARVLWLKKAYEPWGPAMPVDRVGDERKLAGETYMGIEGLILKTLLPVEPAYDMAMNIFTFPPGYSLPMIETHVMEHGLYFLEGQGLYYLGDAWREVRAGDFIWMGPYCPQSYYATSSEPSRYIYYKDVNRDVRL